MLCLEFEENERKGKKNYGKEEKFSGEKKMKNITRK